MNIDLGQIFVGINSTDCLLVGFSSGIEVVVLFRVCKIAEKSTNIGVPVIFEIAVKNT